MRMDLPQCGFKNCRRNFDGNCHSQNDYEKCDYAHDRKRLLVLEEMKKSKKAEPLKYIPLLEIGWKYSCPSCGCAIGINTNCIDYTDKDKYCPSCGQKLDWSV